MDTTQEPYAGGCGLALALLFEGHVSDIHINDIDRSVRTFWHVILNRTEEFIDLMHFEPLTFMCGPDGPGHDANLSGQGLISICSKPYQ
jgi:hypothetical protein